MVEEAAQIVMQPTDHRVRLLLPLFLERDALPKAKAALLAWTHSADKSWACWEKPADVPLLYQVETLPSVYSFLFGEGRGCCAFFRVPDKTANYWFKNGGVFAKVPTDGQPKAAKRPTEFEVCLAAPGIELFLSPHGAGVISVTFTPKHVDSLRHIQELNYRLSQIRKSTAYSFHLPHALRNPNPPPARDAPFTERLGQAGGVFTLMEWVGFLLQPLEALGYRPMQQQFSVYSVTRFDVSANFTDPKAQAALRTYLAAVVHVEEYYHVGSLEVNEQVLNPRHWAAVGSLGAAHLVSDHNHPPWGFDEQRMAISMHKYFIPYLLSLMPRIALQSILEEARDILSSRCGDTSESSDCFIEPLRKLNRHTSALTVNGWFTEISSREVINQYYALAQQGLRVQDSFQTVQRALHNAEAMDNARFQNNTLSKMGELAEQANRSAQIVAHVQTKVEWLEVFFVSYYATALVYYLGKSHLLDENWANTSLLLAPVVAGLIAFFKLRPDKLQKNKDHQLNSPGGHGFMVCLILLFIIWLGIGYVKHSLGAEKLNMPRSGESATVDCPTGRESDTP